MAEAALNGGSSTLAAPITNVATSLSIQAGDVARFPASGTYRLALTDGTNTEIVTVTGGQGTATLTVTRASEAYNGNSSAYAFAAGAVVQHVTTLASLAALTEQHVWAAGPHTSDWFRNDTANFGIYNGATSQGIGLPAGGPTNYATGRPLLDGAPGSITTAMLAAGSVTQLAATQAAPAGNTNSGSDVAAPSPYNAIAFTSNGGYIVVDGVLQLYANGVAGVWGGLGVSFDAGGVTHVSYRQNLPSYDAHPILYFAGGLGAGAHTCHLWWFSNGSTIYWNTGLYSFLRIQEFMR